MEQHATDICLDERSQQKVGLYINAEKCKLMTTSVWRDRPDTGCRFSYRKSRRFLLAWQLSSNGSCEKDAKVRIEKAAAVFGKLRKIWKTTTLA